MPSVSRIRRIVAAVPDAAGAATGIQLLNWAVAACGAPDCSTANYRTKFSKFNVESMDDQRHRNGGQPRQSLVADERYTKMSLKDTPTGPGRTARTPATPRRPDARRNPRASPAGVSVTLPATIAEQLRERIIEGEFAPGARLNERTLCDRLGVSRTPLREAFRLLESDGCIVHQNF